MGITLRIKLIMGLNITDKCYIKDGVEYNRWNLNIDKISNNGLC
jgi:hypothetical protein